MSLLTFLVAGSVRFLSPSRPSPNTWAVTEPFIVPALYEKYVDKTNIAVFDEWTLALAMGENLAKDMEEHYSTFIVRTHLFCLSKPTNVIV